MKNLSINSILVIIIFLCWAPSSYSQLQQCPEGYQTRVVNFQFYNGFDTCWGTATYCYMCTPASFVVDILLQRIDIPIECIIMADTLLTSNFKQKMFEAILDDVGLHNLDPNCTVGPCPDNSQKVYDIYNSSCYKWVHEENSPNIMITPCMEYIICVNTYKICIIYIDGQPKVQKIQTSHGYQNVTNCPIQDRPQPPYELIEPWETDCFHHYPCE